MRQSTGLVCGLAIFIGLGSMGFGATQDRIQLVSAETVTLAGNVRHMAQPQFDQGPVDPTLQLGTITLSTTPTPAQQAALTKLLAEQQDPKSPSYHKWLTPEQFADRFGLSQNDIRQIVNWLELQGFTNVHPARGRNWVSFTGTAAQVQAAFQTEIHNFNVNGRMHYANTTAPKLPWGLSGVVAGIRGLDDFRPRPRARRARPEWYSSGLQSSFVAPGDIATIYDITPLYNAGIDGTCQKLAVMGQTDIYLADLNDFRSGFGLSSLACTTNGRGVITACNDPHFKYVLDGTDPGLSTQGDIGEADLDVEWSGAVARGAQIIFVNSTDTFTSYYYAIDNSIAPVISLSYGFCEFDDNILNADETELQKANSEGITVVNSSGDSGAAECDYYKTVTSTNLATQGLAVSYPASSPEVTGVGGTGTVFDDWNNPQYWGSTNTSTGGSAISYVPEQAWNDDYELAQYCQKNSSNLFCTQGGQTKRQGWVNLTSESAGQTDIGISSTGGGASNCSTQNSNFTACVSGFPKPSWQTVTVSGQTTRLSPDISFLASPNFPGYVFCTPMSELTNTTSSTSSCASGISTAVDQNFSLIGGTSASAPVFAGIVALLNQYTSSAGQGNINPWLYQLAATTPNAFHDATAGDNKVYCEAGMPQGQLSSLICPSSGVLGYSASAGFDLATGLGSLDVNNFAVALASPPDFSASSPTTSMKIYSGGSGTATITLAPINNFSGSVGFACSGLPAGATCSFSPSTVTLPSATQTTATIQTSGTGTSTGNVVVMATTGTLSQLSHQAAAISMTASPAFTLTPSATSYPVAQGSNINVTVAVQADPAFSGLITFTCLDTAPQSVCTAPPNTNVSGNVTFQITTSAPTAKLETPVHRGMKMFYAAFLPGLVGFVLLGTTRRRSMRGMRILGMFMVLGVSTMWMASCGGNSAGVIKNQGTPKSSYTITVTGTSGSATNSASFQLVVQ